MCYNCGCGSPGEDMGKDKNITTKTFEEAATAEGQSIDDAKKNVLELLRKEVGSNEEKPEESQK